MDRATFVQTVLTTLAASPSPSSSPNPWDMCVKSAALPYDRPIDMKMQTLDGPDFHLLSYRGQAVILNIFATWCGPCNQEQPFIVDAAANYASQGLAVIGINDQEEDNTVRAYRKKYGITYPIAMDRRGGFTLDLQNGGTQNLKTLFPVSIFLTPQGYLYCYLTGSVGKNELDYRIRKFLSDAPPTVVPSASASPPTTRRSHVR